MRVKRITGRDYACGTTRELVEERRESPRRPLPLNDFMGWWYD